MLVCWGLCTSSHFDLPRHMVYFSSCEEKDVVIRNGWTPDERERESVQYSMFFYDVV